MTELKTPTKEQILRVAETCSQAKECLDELFPGIFDKEELPLSAAINDGILDIYCQGHVMATTEPPKMTIRKAFKEWLPIYIWESANYDVSIDGHRIYVKKKGEKK